MFNGTLHAWVAQNGVAFPRMARVEGLPIAGGVLWPELL
ncbi:hypothetical protein D047_3037 [Vibrio parahaemolyticus VPTS-2010_2]|nr:hypothetical protein D047_3037 [Vibrio parahaemolyticus VPTS-2010_2]